MSNDGIKEESSALTLSSTHLYLNSYLFMESDFMEGNI